MGSTYFCTRCQTEKPPGAFTPSQVRPNGRGTCRACCNERRNDWRRWRRTNPPAYATCALPGCSNQIPSNRRRRWCSKACGYKGWHLANPGAQRRYIVKCVYGLDDAQFDALVALQGSVCGICQNPPRVTRGKTRDHWNVDHCHTTGVVRGLLCRDCNVGIGQLRDDLELVRSAVQYVEAYLAAPLRLRAPEVLEEAKVLAAVETLYCTRCDEALPISAFPPSVAAKSRGRAWCTKCYTADAQARRSGATPEPRPRRTCQAPGCDVDISHMKRHARWCSKSCTAKGWRHENPNARRAYMVQTLYGITAEQADALLAEQDGACAICHEAPTGQWNIDHCHDSGAVRGVLCSGCNMGIGALGDNPAILRRAVAYLESPPANQLVR